MIATLCASLSAMLLVDAPSGIVWANFVLLGITVLCALGNYQFFALKDPNRLQSESYQLQKDTLIYLTQGRGMEPQKPSHRLVENPEVIVSNDEKGG
jgi:hypothetical protein